MRGKVQKRWRSSGAERITPAYAGKSKCKFQLFARVQDHPRLCGEKLSIHTLEKKRSGSPPPMRGKAVCYGFGDDAERITPAYAGKSEFPPAFTNVSRDHPRLCGEKLARPDRDTQKEGSPPPMRGKVQETADFTHVYRITPAYAGKRVIRSGFHKLFQDHPRLCGEKDTRITGGMKDEGITPAYAGKRALAAVRTPIVRDHPRLCGEKSCTSSRVRSGTGSPPPMRGKGNEIVAYVVADRITPAYAGKRTNKNLVRLFNKDHPRLCGEKLSGTVTPKTDSGSPPPMRGKAPLWLGIKISDGITPAYAGKSQILWISDRSQEDHPRLCGEKVTGEINRCSTTGSPPPMRGKASMDLPFDTIV